ncbi:MAG: hypothetical protein ACP5VR_10345 [Acidimicrobiales bacterium]
MTSGADETTHESQEHRQAGPIGRAEPGQTGDLGDLAVSSSSWQRAEDNTATWDPATEWDETGYSGRQLQDATSWESGAPYSTWEEEATYVAPENAPLRSPRRVNGHWPRLVMVAAVAVIAAAGALAVTSAHRSAPTVQTSVAGGAGTGASGQRTTPARNTPTSAPYSARKASRSPTRTARRTARAAPSSQPSGPQGGAIALAVTPSLSHQLVASWLATDPGGTHLSAADVAGTVAGQVYYGYQPSTKTYWAEAEFRPSRTLLLQSNTFAGQVRLAQFRNWLYLFRWEQGPLWTWVGDVVAGGCPNQYVPAPVLSAWHLCKYLPGS